MNLRPTDCGIRIGNSDRRCIGMPYVLLLKCYFTASSG